jgi:hypothetical protein
METEEGRETRLDLPYKGKLEMALRRTEKRRGGEIKWPNM